MNHQRDFAIRFKRLLVLALIVTYSALGFFPASSSRAYATLPNDLVNDWLRFETAALGHEVTLAARLATRIGLGRLAAGLRAAQNAETPVTTARVRAILKTAPHIPGSCVLLADALPLLSQADPTLSEAALVFIGDTLTGAEPRIYATCEVPPGFVHDACRRLAVLAQEPSFPLALRARALGLLAAASDTGGVCFGLDNTWTADPEPELRRLALFLAPASAQSIQAVIAALDDEDPRVVLAGGLRLCQIADEGSTSNFPWSRPVVLGRARDVALRFARSSGVIVADLIELLDCLRQRDGQLATEPLELARDSQDPAVRAYARSLR